VNEDRQLERLSPLDMSNLRVEDHGLPMHVAALLILEKGELATPRGLDVLREAIAGRLCLVPRLRQVLYWPRPGLGPPVWTDCADFDVREHVRIRPVPAPGDEAALLQACAELNEPQLDRSRPLWQLWLLTGLADGGCALLIRLHHVVADGIAAMAMLGALFDLGPAIPVPAAPGWVPEPAPSVAELATDRLGRTRLAVARATRRAGHPAVLAARLSQLAQQARQAANDGRAPQLSLNVPVGGRHRLVLVRADLERVRTAAHAQGGTVNDVVLTAVAGGARRLLQGRGELTSGLVVKASVPVSIRGPVQAGASGNRVGVMIVPLPVGKSSSADCLVAIIQATRERKRRPPYQPSARLLQRWFVHAMSRQRVVNLLVSNLPGPTTPLSCAGTGVREMFQIGVVQGNVPVSVGVLSYAGQLNVEIVGDPDAVPDLADFAAGVSATLHQLGALDSARRLAPES
jgi:diacylglycerol O-acyltransferase / wax synthase